MSSLPDHIIRDLCRTKGLVEPFDSELLNPASYDVTLGNTILLETPHGFHEIDISTTAFHMGPGSFVLAHTAEWVRIPNDCEAIFQLKSSRGREGYEHALAGYIDPGFHGNVTLELSNLRRYAHLPLQAGMRIGQLRFARLESKPLRPYSVTGRYQNDKGVQESKDDPGMIRGHY